jgi:hypothetical protein
LNLLFLLVLIPISLILISAVVAVLFIGSMFLYNRYKNNQRRKILMNTLKEYELNNIDAFNQEKDKKQKIELKF